MHCKAFVSALAGAALWATAGAAAEAVNIPEGNLTLRATLYRPQGTGPFPAVVALHDCGGLEGRPTTNAEVYGEWSTVLAAKGFVVIFPDSFGSRGVGAQCRLREPKVRASRERVADANAARRWLQTQNFVRRDRISLLGWSSGAIAALWTVRPNATPRDSGADFRSAVALYPGCARLHQTAWSARVPTLILIGGADESTLASTCEQMVAGARGRSARAEIVVYPGAGHDFDRANSLARPRTEPSGVADPPGRVRRGTNPAARADALRRVPLWLAR
ncbi:MAG TPA: dienelactone hydrolase family protein [Xanthobacteraceae bacterium]|nr:dienelactone hydrolase family protein [Xanthobacteraceae bacterium]